MDSITCPSVRLYSIDFNDVQFVHNLFVLMRTFVIRWHDTFDVHYFFSPPPFLRLVSLILQLKHHSVMNVK